MFYLRWGKGKGKRKKIYVEKEMWDWLCNIFFKIVIDIVNVNMIIRNL